jgi:hypothetical protein
VDTPRLETEVSKMPKFRVPYPPEFRRQMVDLAVVPLAVRVIKRSLV